MNMRTRSRRAVPASIPEGDDGGPSGPAAAAAAAAAAAQQMAPGLRLLGPADQQLVLRGLMEKLRAYLLVTHKEVFKHSFVEQQ